MSVASGRGRSRLFGLLAVFVVPSALLLALEGGLRLFGSGFEPGFFVEREIGGERFLTENPRFGWRFFPRGVARAPQRFRVPHPKPEGTVRICVLGGSAAMGDPSAAFGIPRLLEAMLEGCRPDLDVEIVNAAMTAINSHVVLPIARDCLDHEADLLVIYLGNNEVVGPFGVGSVFGVPGATRFVSRAHVLVKSTRIGQLIDGAVTALRPGRPEAWTGMELFLGARLPLGDARLDLVYEGFSRNLAEICRLAEERARPVVLSTVGVNLASCAPFASVHRAGLSETERAAWASAFEAGVALEEAGETAAALARFEEAAAIDDAFAELAFRRARCTSSPERERELYEHARELDALRFRADAGIGRVIRSVASERATVTLVDAAAALEANSPARGPGHELFDDHVHLNFEGNWVVARALLDGILPHLPHGEARAVPDREACAERLGHAPRNRWQTLETMRKRRDRAPFASQADVREWEWRLDREIAELRVFTQPHHVRKALASVRETLTRHPQDWTLREELARLLVRTENLTGALEERRRILRAFPYSADAHFELGSLLRRTGDGDEALAEFRETVRRSPGHFLARQQLGDLLVERGEYEKAARHLAEAVRRQPDLATAHRSLGEVMLRMERPDEALGHLRRAVEVNPDLAAAHKKMGDALAVLERRDEAAAAYREALRVNPQYAAAIEGLSRVLAHEKKAPGGSLDSKGR